MNVLSRIALLICLFLPIARNAVAQTPPDEPKPVRHLAGNISLTNNGISIIPTFMLGKPALLFDLSIGGPKLRFDPMLRFGADGKPWSFVFWWRYKLLNTKRFSLGVGAHPAFAFVRTTTTTNGTSDEKITVQRFVAAEVAPTYKLTPRISLGLYYLTGLGLDRVASIRRSHFLATGVNFSDIRLGSQLFMRFNPQVYYLRLDQYSGYYVTATTTLGKRGFPLTLQSIVNKTIQSNLPGNNNFVWNVSVVYAFDKAFVRQ